MKEEQKENTSELLNQIDDELNGTFYVKKEKKQFGRGTMNLMVSVHEHSEMMKRENGGYCNECDYLALKRNDAMKRTVDRPVGTRVIHVPDNGVCSVNAAILKLKLPGVGKIFVSGRKFCVDVCSDSTSCSLLLADAGGRSDAAAPESDESSLLPPLPLLPPVSSSGSHLMLSSSGLFSSCTPLPSTLLDRWLFFTIEKSVGVASLLLSGGDGTLGFFADSSTFQGACCKEEISGVEDPSVRFRSTEFQQLTIVLRLLDTTGVGETQIYISYLEQFSKIGTAGGEYNAVRFEALAIAGQGDVHEILIVPQVLKRRRYTALEPKLEGCGTYTSTRLPRNVLREASTEPKPVLVTGPIHGETWECVRSPTTPSPHAAVRTSFRKTNVDGDVVCAIQRNAHHGEIHASIMDPADQDFIQFSGIKLFASPAIWHEICIRLNFSNRTGLYGLYGSALNYSCRRFFNEKENKNAVGSARTRKIGRRMAGDLSETTRKIRQQGSRGRAKQGPGAGETGSQRSTSARNVIDIVHLHELNNTTKQNVKYTLGKVYEELAVGQGVPITRRETPSSAVGAGGDVPGPPMVGEIQHPSGSQPLSRVGLPERAMRSYTGCIIVSMLSQLVELSLDQTLLDPNLGPFVSIRTTNKNEHSVSRLRQNVCERLPTAYIHTYFIRFSEEDQGKFKIDICLYVDTECQKYINSYKSRRLIVNLSIIEPPFEENDRQQQLSGNDFVASGLYLNAKLVTNYEAESTLMTSVVLKRNIARNVRKKLRVATCRFWRFVGDSVLFIETSGGFSKHVDASQGCLDASSRLPRCQAEVWHRCVRNTSGINVSKAFFPLDGNALEHGSVVGGQLHGNIGSQTVAHELEGLVRTIKDPYYSGLVAQLRRNVRQETTPVFEHYKNERNSSEQLKTIADNLRTAISDLNVSLISNPSSVENLLQVSSRVEKFQFDDECEANVIQLRASVAIENTQNKIKSTATGDIHAEHCFEKYQTIKVKLYFHEYYVHAQSIPIKFPQNNTYSCSRFFEKTKHTSKNCKQIVLNSAQQNVRKKVHLPVEERYARLPGQGAQVPCLRTNSSSHGPAGSDFGGDGAEDPRDASPLRERIEEAAGGEVAQPLLSNLAAVARQLVENTKDMTDQSEQAFKVKPITRFENCREFTICELHSTASSDNSCETDTWDQLDTFSMTVTRCLKKLDKPCALKAQAKIQRILRNMLMKSKLSGVKNTRRIVSASIRSYEMDIANERSRSIYIDVTNKR
ncbi:hypothetical protein WN51_12972 [Melipona quadrifasciata]|uniref:Uncharacterized protein n=1 Tax=Melipona quadrifasciata TaxID=166423 RepID=A0A0M9ACS1_9HYME|nr:hypothetical protein WN51_12972 [Melipona quadrifasciata]